MIGPIDQHSDLAPELHPYLRTETLRTRDTAMQLGYGLHDDVVSVCDRLIAALDQIERLERDLGDKQEMVRKLTAESVQDFRQLAAKDAEWMDILYSLIDAIGAPRGESLPEDVEHAKAKIADRLAAIQKQAAELDRLHAGFRAAISRLSYHCPVPDVDAEIEAYCRTVEQAAHEAKGGEDECR